MLKAEKVVLVGGMEYADVYVIPGEIAATIIEEGKVTEVTRESIVLIEYTDEHAQFLIKNIAIIDFLELVDAMGESLEEFDKQFSEVVKFIDERREELQGTEAPPPGPSQYQSSSSPYKQP